MNSQKKVWLLAYANSLDAYVPELWAAESLMILKANMVATRLVHRAFEDEIAQYGDVVNTRQPGTFVSKRKTDTDDVTDQDATATNVAVPLDQWHHVTFIIHDGEESKGFKPLVTEFLEPAIIAIANALDQIVLGQVYQFLDNVVGKLSTTPTRATMLDADEKLNTLKAPLQGRNMIVTPAAKGDLLNIDDFIHADKRGDAGTAMRTASLGYVLGFDTYMCQNCPQIATGNTVNTATVNHSAGYAIGSTSIVCGSFSASDPVAGEWCTIAGDMTPQFITAYGASSGILTISPGLKSAVVHGAAVTAYQSGDINKSAGYASGYAKELTIDQFTVAPKSTQMMSTGVTTSTLNKYAMLQTPTTTSVLLDRPLAAAVANNATLGIGPAGSYNFAFHKNALALVSRPLATPMAGTGALSYVAQDSGLGIRVTITYDGKAQGHRVTVDLLCGIKILNSSLGCVMLT